jgi:hypothetical protein
VTCTDGRLPSQTCAIARAIAPLPVPVENLYWRVESDILHAQRPPSVSVSGRGTITRGSTAATGQNFAADDVGQRLAALGPAAGSLY